MYYTEKTIVASVVEYNRRSKLGAKAYQKLSQANHSTPLMKTARRVTIRPRSLTWIDAQISGKNIGNCHSFLSNYAEDVDQVTIPNLTFRKRHHRYKLPVINETSSTLTFPAGKILGSIIQHSKDPAEDSKASVFHLVPGKTLENLDEVRERLKHHKSQPMMHPHQTESHHHQDSHHQDSHHFSNSAVQSANQQLSQQNNQQTISQQQKPQQSSLNTDKRVRFSDIQDIDKLDQSTLNNIHEHGINVDISSPLNYIDSGEFLRLEVDIEKERKKGADSDMWDDRTEEEYIKLFKRNPMITDEHYETWKSILLDFKHVFFNPKKPEKFSGLKMNPIEVTSRPGAIPKKDRLYWASDVKEPYILEHLETLEKQGVIKQASDLSAGYLSNVVLVLESRYIASQGREVKKSRFCLNYI